MEQRMHQFPHIYSVSANASAESLVTLSANGVESISSAPPLEFDGPGDQWSPESLLVAAVADCFILSFRAIARASRLDWSDLSCDVDGALDKSDGGPRFTAFTVRVRVTIDDVANTDKAEKLLQKAEHACLITNSLIADSHLETEVNVAN
jgi:organic hydroperoxide reductase OsmC/OhrA